MKRILIFAAVIMTTSLAMAQDVYRTDFSNNPNHRIKIDAAPHSVTIIGHDKNEIIIEAIVKPNKKAIEPAKESSERSKGLKPMTPSGTDNTGIGLTVEKSENQFTVKNIAGNAVEGEYIFRIPNKAKLSINELKPWSKSSFQISAMYGEMNITGLNSGFVIKDVSGPVVMQNTNGNIEIVFNELAPDKPNSFTAVNGFVDITLPGKTKADFKINAVNGEAYTDFDIKAESGNDGTPVFPIINIFNLKGSINGGGASFNVSAVNGNVYIRKGN